MLTKQNWKEKAKTSHLDTALRESSLVINTKYLLCPRHCDKHFAGIKYPHLLFTIIKLISPIIVPISQMRQLSLTEIK